MQHASVPDMEHWPRSVKEGYVVLSTDKQRECLHMRTHCGGALLPVCNFCTGMYLRADHCILRVQELDGLDWYDSEHLRPAF